MRRARPRTPGTLVQAHSDRTSDLSNEQTFVFGPFCLSPGRRQLSKSGQPVGLGNRAIDLLICLIEHSGSVVPADKLISVGWPNTFVHESNLRVNIAMLRKALDNSSLGPRIIVNDAGRGYSFVVPVERRGKPPTRQIAGTQEFNNLPVRLAPTIGRTEVVRALTPRLLAGNVVTLVGPGGIGKTTTAIEIARPLAGSFPDGVLFVDLATLSEPSLVPSALAAPLGLLVH